MGVSPRALGLMVLSGDETFMDFLKERVPGALIESMNAIRDRTEPVLKADLRTLIDHLLTLGRILGHVHFFVLNVVLREKLLRHLAKMAGWSGINFYF